MEKLNKQKKIEKNIKKISSIIVPILKKYKTKKAAIFGSFATGENNRNSDIDILFEKPKNISGLDYINIQLELQDKLKTNVDLVQYKLLRSALRKEILSSQIKII